MNGSDFSRSQQTSYSWALIMQVKLRYYTCYKAIDSLRQTAQFILTKLKLRLAISDSTHMTSVDIFKREKHGVNTAVQSMVLFSLLMRQIRLDYQKQKRSWMLFFKCQSSKIFPSSFLATRLIKTRQ